MTSARPHNALVHLALAALVLVAALWGSASAFLAAEDPDLATVEVEYENESEREPQPEDDRDDDDDDAMARGDAEGVDPGARVAPPLENQFAHPSNELDRIFRPPIA